MLAIIKDTYATIIESTTDLPECVFVYCCCLLHSRCLPRNGKCLSGFLIDLVTTHQYSAKAVLYRDNLILNCLLVIVFSRLHDVY